ncbi:hypothetical protein DFH09DRAFT_1367056 [Mycena vulgaris]|nr:hypothetical protein DFH09DRAFT_1367056 [Mycena vulgaris]
MATLPSGTLPGLPDPGSTSSPAASPTSATSSTSDTSVSTTPVTTSDTTTTTTSLPVTSSSSSITTSDTTTSSTTTSSTSSSTTTTSTTSAVVPTTTAPTPTPTPTPSVHLSTGAGGTVVTVTEITQSTQSAPRASASGAVRSTSTGPAHGPAYPFLFLVPPSSIFTSSLHFYILPTVFCASSPLPFVRIPSLAPVQLPTSTPTPSLLCLTPRSHPFPSRFPPLPFTVPRGARADFFPYPLLLSSCSLSPASPPSSVNPRPPYASRFHYHTPLAPLSHSLPRPSLVALILLLLPPLLGAASPPAASPIARSSFPLIPPGVLPSSAAPLAPRASFPLPRPSLLPFRPSSHPPALTTPSFHPASPLVPAHYSPPSRHLPSSFSAPLPPRRTFLLVLSPPRRLNERLPCEMRDARREVSTTGASTSFLSHSPLPPPPFPCVLHPSPIPSLV